MGGYGAIRFSLAHPDLFVSSIVLSPAVYVPKPPDDSSTREFGAFGRGQRLFSTAIYKSLNYPEELRALRDDGTEVAHVRRGRRRRVPEPDGDDITTSTSSRCQLYKTVERVPNMTVGAARAQRRPRLGRLGPGFEEGAKYAFQFVARPEVSIMKATLIGTPGEDREGGVAVDADGNVYEALAAMGSIDGQTERRRQGRRADQVRPDRHEALDEGVRHRRHRPRLRARARPARASGRRRLHEGQPRRRARRQHERRRLRRRSTTRAGTASG